MNNLNPTFGLGDAAVIDSIKVIWPGGTTDYIGQTDANQFIIIKEGVGIVTNEVDNNLPVVTGYSLSSNYPNPFNPSTVINITLCRQNLT